MMVQIMCTLAQCPYFKFAYRGKWRKSDGTFIELGFRPAIIWIKKMGMVHWNVYDSERSQINPTTISYG